MTDFILGLHGLKRSGKDTFAAAFYQAMRSNHKVEWHVDSFAAPLRALGLSMFGITEENREHELDGIGKSGRQFLQIVGTEVVRQFHPDTWLRSFEYRTRSYERVVCTDVRFNNEAEFIRQRGGMILHIVRPAQTMQGDKHVSEAGIASSYINYSLMNDSTLASWLNKAENFAADFSHYCGMLGMCTPYDSGP